MHALRVVACDNAGNCRDISYSSEVWIDADGWCFSVLVTNSPAGAAMSCVVEFPAPYSVGRISLPSSTLAVLGSLALGESYPIVGEAAVLQAQLLTGVGDHDEDRIADRKLKFAKRQFVAALNAQTGPTASIVTGGLLPVGQPRFLAGVTVPVFDSPRK